jgi:uncharacterized glyoxalase superfamily protein PhnB
MKLDAIGIIVSDMGNALPFYRMLGLPIAEGAEAEDHVECALPSGLRLMWDTEALVHSFDPEWASPVGQRVGLAFLCDSPAEVDATYARLIDAGYHGHKEPWDAFWGQRYAQVHDPDGTVVDLFAML